MPSPVDATEANLASIGTGLSLTNRAETGDEGFDSSVDGGIDGGSLARTATGTKSSATKHKAKATDWR